MKIENITGFIAISVISAVYLATVSPSIAGGDSGEIVAEGCHLGTAHPPGYPIITLIINAVSRLDLGLTVAYRINIFCSACTVAACWFIGQITNKLSLGVGNGHLLAMGMFAFSPLIWQYAISAEVFPLNTFFAALILYFVVEFSISRKLSVAYLGAFICGLAFCNQHTILLYEAPLVLWMLFLLRRHILTDISVLFKLSICYIIGALPYIYLPISALYHPKQGSWGHVTTWNGFLHHILRKDYGTFQLFSGATGRNTEGFTQRTLAYFHDVYTTQGLYIVPILACIGIITSILYHTILNSSSNNSSNSIHYQELDRVDSKPNLIHLQDHKKTNNNSNSINNKQSNKIKLGNNNNNRQQPQQQQHSSNVDSRVLSDNSELISMQECRYTPIVLLLTQLCYFGIFHSLANLPLGDKLLFGVHQRFWMQPNVLLFIWSGIGYNDLWYLITHIVLWMVNNNDNHSNRGSNKNKLKNNNRANSTGIVNSKIKKTSVTQQIQQNDDDENTKITNLEHETKIKRTNQIINTIVNILSILVAAICVYVQCTKHYYAMDNSQSYYFNNYAKAILDPLPANAILLINYDQQWTSIRYMQICEHYRTDITTIQLSMMTYHWFQHKRDLYPHLVFPGTFATYPNSPSIATYNAFTVLSFLNSNVQQHPNIYIGGKLSYHDPQLNDVYDLVPVGMVTQFVPMSRSPNGDIYANQTYYDWNVLLSHLPSLPDVKKYPEETWEWTIGRDFKDRVADTAAYMLLSALKVTSQTPQPLIDSIYWLETSILLENGMKYAPTSLLKNIGLAHVHLIQNKLLTTTENRLTTGLSLPTQDLFHTLDQLNWPVDRDWKAWAADRFVLYWGEFVKRKDAIQDPQYKKIKEMYEIALKNK